MRHRTFVVACCLLASCLAVAGFAVEKRPGRPHPGGAFWPGWRGPNRDAISDETGLLPSWDRAAPRLIWNAENLGRGFSSLSIADGRIFTLGDRDGRQVVIALDLRSGKELWSAPLGDVWEPNGYAGPRSTPTVDGRMLYVLGPHGDLVCLTTAGREVWRRHMQRDFGGRMHSGWGYSESPLVDGQKLVVTPGGAEAGLVALDKTTGREIWRSPLASFGGAGSDGAAYSSIVVSNGGGVRQYIQLVGRGVIGVDALRGDFLWGYNRVANGTANIPTPLVNGDYVFCSTGYGAGAALLKLAGDGRGGVDAQEVYFLNGKTFQNHHGGMVMLGDYIYAGHGHNRGAPICLQWKTGKTVWRHNRGPGSGSAAVSFADGNLYFRFQNGLMALIAATPDAYRELGTFQIPDVEQPSWSHPVIAGGKLYLREQDALYCYDLKP